MNRDGTLIKLRKPFLYFDNIDINSVEEAKSLEDSNGKLIKNIEGDFLSLAMSTPKDITPKGEDPVNYIKEKVKENLENLYDAYYDDFSIRTVNEILNEWEYSFYSDSKEIYESCKSNEEINKNAFPKDKHEEIKRDPNRFTFAPSEDNIQESIIRCVKNLKLNDELSDFIGDKYIIIENKKIYSDYDGQFIFKSEEDAKKVLAEKFEFHAIDYISKDFINAHPNFFKSVIDLMKEYNMDKEYINKFETAYNSFVENENNRFSDMNILETLYDTLENVLFKVLYIMCDIRIVKLKDLI